MKKEYFVIVDTETTKDDSVFDFAAIVVDRKGVIYHSVACIVAESAKKELFYDNSAEWSMANASAKKAKYSEMVSQGNRHVYSVAAINRWLEKINAKYNPVLTAYNSAFDIGKCANTGIDLSIFSQTFCLWHLACEMFASKKDYKKFALENHYFGNRTKNGNMTIKTNAEVMAHYITGNYSAEPHTALEDAQYYELPILVAAVNKKGWKQNIGKAYNWKNYILKNHYKA